MIYNKKTIYDIAIAGKKVLLRCDLDISRDGKTFELSSNNRIAAALPTIQYLLDKGAAVIACAHLGAPKGRQEEALSLAPVAVYLGELLGRQVIFAGDAIGEDAKVKAAALKGGEIMLLENLRFYAEEEQNDPAFSSELASMAELYVSDSFCTAHCAHASTVGVAAYLPAVSGLLLARELEAMEKIVAQPGRPLVAVLGGAAVGSKIDLVDELLDRIDTLVIGGGLSNTFLKARGGRIGSSLWDAEKYELAAALLEKAKVQGVKVFLPMDTLAANEISPNLKPSLEGAMALFEDKIGMDIGPRTVEHFRNVILRAGTVVWSGPMGIIELPAFANGTKGIAGAVAESTATTVICGGDSADAAERFGVAGKITHITTSGDAALAYVAGRSLPGVACLLDN